MKKIDEYRILLISFLFAIFIHGFIFLALKEIKPEEKKIEKKKIVYINIVKPEEKKKAVPKPKKKIPKKVKKIKSHPKSKPKPHPKPEPKPKPKPKPRPKPLPKPKPVSKPKSLKPEEKFQEKKIVEVKEKELKEIQKKIEDINIPENTLEPEPFNISKLKGKELIYQHGKEKKEEKKSDKDVMEYIKALEEYLNELARRKDLYPPMAKRLRIEGSLVVRFTIRADGSVDENSIQIVESSNYNVLDKGAVKLIKKYVPEFAKKYGKKPPKGDLTIELPVTFEIIGW